MAAYEIGSAEDYAEEARFSRQSAKESRFFGKAGTALSASLGALSVLAFYEGGASNLISGSCGAIVAVGLGLGARAVFKEAETYDLSAQEYEAWAAEASQTS